MRFFGGNTSHKDPPSSSGYATSNIKITSERGANSNVPSDDIRETAWNSPSSNEAKSSRSKKDGISRRSSMDSIAQRKKEKDKATLLRCNSEFRPKEFIDQASLDPHSRQEFGRLGHSDHPTGKERKEKKKKKKQTDAPQEGGRDSMLGSSIGGSNKGGNEHNKGLKNTSFQDVLKKLNTDVSGHENEKNPFVKSPSSSRSRSAGHMPTLDENQQDNNSSTKLDFSGFESKKKTASSLQTLLENANFSSDCSVGTVNTTTQCALSLGHLIEEMQVEFEKLKKQKNKAESYAEKLHTDYVRMQEGLERDFEKACQERDQLKIAREKDAMVSEKLKEQVKALKSENAVLKDSMRTADERSRKAEEENGRMKIALEALLVRSGALNEGGKPKDAKPIDSDGGTRRGKKDRQQDHFYNKNGSVNAHDGVFRRDSTSESGSLPCSPEIRPAHTRFVYPKSADHVKPMLDSAEGRNPKKAVTLPFDCAGKRREGLSNHLSATMKVLDEFHDSFTPSEVGNLNTNRDGDDDSVASNHTVDDGTIDTPTPC